MYRKNPLINCINSGKPAIGAWAALTDASVVEILALSGFDYIILDQEHGAGDISNLPNLLRAFSGTPCSPVLRLGAYDPGKVKQAMDAGVEGLMIPNVETPEQAREIADMCRYPPKGRRGLAPNAARGASFGLEMRNYVETVNDNFILMLQIESQLGVDNARAIIETDGVDMLFAGPMDLSADMGHLLDLGHPDVYAAVDSVRDQAIAAGKWAGTVPHGDRDSAMLGKDGWHIVAGFVDIMALRDAAAGYVADFRNATL